MPFSELRELPQSFIKVSWSAFHTALNLIKATLTAFNAQEALCQRDLEHFQLKISIVFLEFFLVVGSGV